MEIGYYEAQLEAEKEYYEQRLADALFIKTTALDKLRVQVDTGSGYDSNSYYQLSQAPIRSYNETVRQAGESYAAKKAKIEKNIIQSTSDPINPSGKFTIEQEQARIDASTSNVIGVFNLPLDTYTPSPGLPGGELGSVSGAAATLGALKVQQGLPLSSTEESALYGNSGVQKPSSGSLGPGVGILLLLAALAKAKKK